MQCRTRFPFLGVDTAWHHGCTLRSQEHAGYSFLGIARCSLEWNLWKNQDIDEHKRRVNVGEGNNTRHSDGSQVVTKIKFIAELGGKENDSSWPMLKAHKAAWASQWGPDSCTFRACGQSPKERRVQHTTGKLHCSCHYHCCCQRQFLFLHLNSFKRSHFCSYSAWVWLNIGLVFKGWSTCSGKGISGTEVLIELL